MTINKATVRITSRVNSNIDALLCAECAECVLKHAAYTVTRYRGSDDCESCAAAESYCGDTSDEVET